MACLAYLFCSAVTDFVEFNSLLTFFTFALRTVFILCFRFIVCDVFSLQAYYDDYTYCILLRYVTFVCNNTLDILRDVRYCG